jgi:4-amino-4-deoxy-L-arabinose transferase-like glycosyltransferase
MVARPRAAPVLSVLKRVPASLVALLLAVMVIAVAWALLVPAWQAPDENRHFAYVQSDVEHFERGQAVPKFFSTEQRLASLGSNPDQIDGFPQGKPEWRKEAYLRWQKADRALSASAREDGTARRTSTTPPLYYAYESLAYRAASGGDIFDRLFVMRLWSALLLLGTVAATWLLAGEIFGRDRQLQLAAAALVGLQPMVSFITASVNPDALLFAAWAVALWLGTRILKRGPTASSVIGLVAAVGVASTAKTAGFALVPAAIFVLGVSVWRMRVANPRRAIAFAAAGVMAAAIVVSGVLATDAASGLRNYFNGEGDPSTPSFESFNVREFGSYVWQFYLPKLPFQHDFPLLPDSALYETWIKTGWGAFGWLEIRLPNELYVVLAALSAFALAAAAVSIARGRVAVGWPVITFFGLAALALAGGLHLTEYWFVVKHNVLFNQGRYMLPLIPLGGLAVAAGISLLRRRAVAVGLLLGALLTLQLLSLGVVASRFYA